MKSGRLVWLGLFISSLAVSAADSTNDVSGGTPPITAAIPAKTSSASKTQDLAPNVAEVVKLSEAGLGNEVVLAFVKNCPSSFNLSANLILRLKEAGVASPVITAMLTHDHTLPPPTSPQFSYEQKLYSPAGGAPAQPSTQPQLVAEQPVGAQPQAQPAAQPQSVAAPAVVVSQAPPPPRVEVVTVAPGPDYEWSPGYWTYDGGWIWIGGGWGIRGGYRWGGRYGWGYGHGGGWRGGPHRR